MLYTFSLRVLLNIIVNSGKVLCNLKFYTNMLIMFLFNKSMALGANSSGFQVLFLNNMFL